MKTIHFILIITILSVSQLFAQKSVETITKEVSFADNSSENILLLLFLIVIFWLLYRVRTIEELFLFF